MLATASLLCHARPVEASIDRRSVADLTFDDTFFWGIMGMYLASLFYKNTFKRLDTHTIQKHTVNNFQQSIKFA
jgi:hypothetical protein